MRNDSPALIPALFCSGLVVLALQCSKPDMMAGTVTQSGNGRVTGTLVTASGAPSSGTQVELFPADYDPVRDGALVPADTTDATGRYTFAEVKTGSYNMVAVQPDRKTNAAKFGIIVADDTVMPLPDTMRIPGSIKVVIPNAMDTVTGYVYVPGTTIYSRLRGNNGYVVLDSVPAGVTMSIYYAAGTGTTLPDLLRDSALVIPGGMATIEYVGWKYRKNLSFNTTASGADVAGNVTDFPVLLRLTSDNFNFAEAGQNGNDIRFTKSDGMPLSYEIERWNASSQAAEVWVRVDTVFGDNNSQFITMYWGNPNAASTSNSAAVFDTAAGFQGVWHLGESGGTSPDATKNHYDGTPSNPAPAQASGIIGNSQQFDGASTYISAAGTASGKLNFSSTASYSVSAWVYVDTLDTLFQKIVEKNNVQYKLQIDQFKYWSFSELDNANEYEMTNAPASAKEWVYVAGVRAGAMQYLYVNGQCVNSTITYGPYSGTRDTTTDVVIGNSSGNPLGCFFKGKIDEVRIQSTACSADWIKLCAMNQKADDALITIRK